jgi:hypothetical protein
LLSLTPVIIALSVSMGKLGHPVGPEEAVGFLKRVSELRVAKAGDDGRAEHGFE